MCMLPSTYVGAQNLIAGHRRLSAKCKPAALANTFKTCLSMHNQFHNVIKYT